MTARLLSLILLLSAFLAAGVADARAAETGGFVDTTSTHGSRFLVAGWAGGISPEDGLTGIDVFVNGEPCVDPQLSMQARRPDVVAATGRKDWVDCGWVVNAGFPKGLKVGWSPVRVVVHFAKSGAVELPASTTAGREVEVQRAPRPDYRLWTLVALVIAGAVWGAIYPDAPAVKYGGWLLVAAVFCALAWRQHHFVENYSVNMMFLDQWDFYRPMFQEWNLWRVFDEQEGPTRWGVGLVVTEGLSKLSGWDSRWEAFGVSFIVMGSAVLGLLVARRCGVRAGAAWAAVPLVFLNIRQYESFVGTQILGHGAMPVFLLMSYSLAWFIPGRGWRLAVLSGLTFLLIFTGFGLFMGLIAPVLLIVELLQAVRAKEKKHGWQVVAALCVVGLAGLLFLHGYRIEPVAPGFKFPWDRPVEYFYFMALMLTNFFGIAGHTPAVIAAGLCMVAGLVVICCWNAKVIVQGGVENNRRSVVLFTLSAFSLVYMANAAVGRICLGLYGASAASRYVTLGAVAGFVFFLQLATLRVTVLKRPVKIAGLLGAAYAVALAAGTLSLRQDDWTNAKWFHDTRAQWKEAYLKNGDAMLASQTLGAYYVYPRPEAIKGRLEYLREHRLNLFNGKGD